MALRFSNDAQQPNNSYFKIDYFTKGFFHRATINSFTKNHRKYHLIGMASTLEDQITAVITFGEANRNYHAAVHIFSERSICKILSEFNVQI